MFRHWSNIQKLDEGQLPHNVPDQVDLVNFEINIEINITFNPRNKSEQSSAHPRTGLHPKISKPSTCSATLSGNIFTNDIIKVIWQKLSNYTFVQKNQRMERSNGLQIIYRMPAKKNNCTESFVNIEPRKQNKNRRTTKTSTNIMRICKKGYYNNLLDISKTNIKALEDIN